MGNKFETLSSWFSQTERYSVIVPGEILKILQENLKTPYVLYDFCNNMFSEPCMMFGFIMNKKEFILSVQRHLKLDGDGSDLLNIFNIFMMQSTEPMSGQPRKVVNVLEFLTALILLANFGEVSSSDLHHNAELIEHKINLLLLLFDLRKSNSMNISEIIIMLRTAILSLSKIFPNVQFFKSQHILNEIKQTMVLQFQSIIESSNQEVKIEQSKGETFKSQLEGLEGEKSTGFLGFNKKQSVGREIGGLGNTVNLFSSSTGSTSDTSTSLQGTPTGVSAQQKHINETLEEKKKRLFKWNSYERVLIPLENIKDTLIRNRNVIKYLSLFSMFNKVTLVWGSNKNMSQGLHIHKDFVNFYKQDEQSNAEKVVGLSADKAVRELLNLSKKQSKDNDDMLLFQALIQKWQDSLIIQRTQNEALQQNMMKAKKQYARIEIYTKPTLMMSMLNTQSAQIVANNRITITKSPEGLCHSIGKDFRNKIADQDERQFGIPRKLNIQQPVSQIALGKDHAIFLTTDSILYSMGSNQFGQLGQGTSLKKDVDFLADSSGSSIILNSSQQQFDEFMQEQSSADVTPKVGFEGSFENILHTFEHPINCEKIEYTPEPIPISLKTFEDDEVVYIVAGDHHSMLLTARGKVYAWGLGNKGQLGVPRRKGLINNLLTKDGIQYSPKPVLVEALSNSVVEIIMAKNNSNFAVSSSGNIYNWGHLPRGLSLEPRDIIIDEPQKNKRMQPYAFRRINLTKDSAIAIGKSVELKFQIPESDESISEYVTKNQSKNQILDSSINVTIHAIPVFDGQLIRSEKELNDAIQDNPEMTLNLINDFDVPWYEFKGKSYPKYRKKIQLRIDTERDDGAGDSDKDQDKEDEMEEEDPNEDESDGRDGEDKDDGEEDSDDDGKDEKPNSERTLKSKKSMKSSNRKKGQKKKDSEEISKMERREHETSLFKNRLNVNKPYFRAFINRFNGIAEADSADEISKDNSVREGMSEQEDGEERDSKEVDQTDRKKDTSEDEEDEESGDEKAEGDDLEENESEETGEQSTTKKKKSQKTPAMEQEGEEKSQEEEDEPEDQIVSSDSEIDDAEIIAQFTNKNGILVDELQLQKEEAYNPPDKPETKKKTGINKLECYKLFENSQALLVNYLASDYNYFLKKIIGLISIIPSTLRMLIVPLPKGAANVDTYQAKLIQQIISFAGEENSLLTVMFIAWESHQQIMKHFYRIENKAIIKVRSEITVSAKLSEGTLVYSWGSAACGKLGNGIVRPNQLDAHSDFIREDLGAQLENESERGINQYYTFTPQPIVSLLGHKIRDLACGQHHCLALTTCGDLYSWGDNSQSQLGLDPQNLTVAVPLFPMDIGQIASNNEKGQNDISQPSPSQLSGFNDNASEEQKNEDDSQRINQFDNQGTSLFANQRPLLNQKKSAQPNQKSGQAGISIRLAFAKVPYKVRPIENFDSQNGGQQNAAPGNAAHYNSIQSTSSANNIGTESNPYELIACGDYNSYAVLTL